MKNQHAVQVLGTHADERASSILSPRALRFVGDVVRAFRPRIDSLLASRRMRRELYERGVLPDFRADSAHVRASAWRCLPEPPVLTNRTVESASAVGRASMLEALRSGATGVIADFEDATSPTWANVIDGQIVLQDVVRGAGGGPSARKLLAGPLATELPTLFVRPRGIQRLERHVLVDGRAAPAALFDLALFCFHNARALARVGRGPFFYLPKLESHEEARLWNDVFCHVQKALGVPRGMFKATVVVDTLSAVFEMNEILWELREHSAGLGCGRWDLVFDYIRTRAADPKAILPDRRFITADKAFFASVSALLVQVCHRRGVHAIGGATGRLPVEGDRMKNAQALATVRAEKIRQANDGYDGTRTAGASLVPVARQVFGAVVRGDNQLHVKREDVFVSREDLLVVPSGERTERGVRENLRIALVYLDAWLTGEGRVALDHRVQDAAAAESARAHLWQWARHLVRLDDGPVVTHQRFRGWLAEEADRAGVSRHARVLLEQLCLSRRFEEFMPSPAHELLTARTEAPLQSATPSEETTL